jgi:type I restriction enzyme S subunit
LKREIPEGWEVKSLGECFDMYQPQTISEKDFIMNGEYFVFGANGIIGNYDKFNHKDSEVIITCRGNSCGNIIKTVPYSWITGNAMVLKSRNKNYSIQYIYQLLHWSGIKNVITGSGQPQITRTNLEKILIIEPNKNLLIKYKKTIGETYKISLNIFNQYQKLKETRDWLLPMLMNGQVRVKDE